MKKGKQIGYVAGIMYNSEGNISEWLFGKSGDLEGHDNTTKIFKTEKAAQRFINKRDYRSMSTTDSITGCFVRPFCYEL